MEKQYTQKLICGVLTSVYLLAGFVTASAQTWHAKKEGMDVTSSKAVYGAGTSMVVGNSSQFSGGVPIYYRPDSTTPFTGCTSNFGSFNAEYTPAIVKCNGKIFAGTANGGIYKSTDGGQTWTATAETDIAYGLYSDGTTLYGGVGAGLGAPKTSTDDGATWTSIPNFTGAICVSFLKYNGVLYAGTTSGLQYTADDGATWHTISSPGAMSGAVIVGIAQLSGAVYAATPAGAFESTDNGVTWTNVITEDFSCLVAIDTVLMGGTAQHGIQMSDKNGGNWHQVNTGLPFTGVAAFYDINCISFNDQFVIASAQGDSGVYVTSMAGLGLTAGTSTGVAVQQKAEAAVTISPNPAQNEAAIILTGVWSDAKAALYNLSGRCIKNIDCKKGSDTKLSLNEVPAGIYFLQITDGKQHEIKKLVVTK